VTRAERVPKRAPAWMQALRRREFPGAQPRERLDHIGEAGLVEKVEGLDDRDVELELFIGDPLHPGLGLAEVLDEVEELARAATTGAARGDRHQEVAKVGDEVGGEPGEIFSRLGLLRDDPERAAGIRAKGVRPA